MQVFIDIVSVRSVIGDEHARLTPVSVLREQTVKGRISQIVALTVTSFSTDQPVIITVEAV